MVGEKSEVTCEINDTAMSGTKIPRSRPAWDNTHCKDPLSSGTLVGALDTDVGSHLTRGELWAKELPRAHWRDSVKAGLPDESVESPERSLRQGAERSSSKRRASGRVDHRPVTLCHPHRVVSDESWPLSESVSPSRKGRKIPRLTHVIGLLVGSTKSCQICQAPPSRSC